MDDIDCPMDTKAGKIDHCGRAACVFWIPWAIVLGFRLLFIGRVMPSGDEVYLWAWSRNLDWSYYEHPAFIAWQIALTTALFGDTAFGIRLGSVLIMSLISWILYRWGREMDEDPWVGIGAGLAVLVVPVFAFGAVYTAADVALALWWLLASWFLWKATVQKKVAYWYLAGVAFLLGCLTKYTMVFGLAGAFAYLGLEPGTRRYFKSKWPWIVIAISALSAIPFFIWNIQNDWAALFFQLQTRHHASWTPAHLLRLWGGQMLVISPVLFVCMMCSWVSAVYPDSEDRIRRTRRLLLVMTVTPAVILSVLAIRIRINPFWAITGYTCGLLLLTSWMRDARAGEASRRRRTGAFVAGCALCLVMIVPLHVLVFYPEQVLRSDVLKIAGRPTKLDERQLKKFYGWENLANRVDEWIREEGRPGETFILTSSTTTSSYLAYYMEGQPQTYLYREELPDGTIYGESSPHGLSYLYWQDLDKRRGQDAVFIKYRARDRSDERLQRYFKAWEKIEILPVEHEGETLRRFYLYHGREFLDLSELPKFP